MARLLKEPVADASSCSNVAGGESGKQSSAGVNTAWRHAKARWIFGLSARSHPSASGPRQADRPHSEGVVTSVTSRRPHVRMGRIRPRSIQLCVVNAKRTLLRCGVQVEYEVPQQCGTSFDPAAQVSSCHEQLVVFARNALTRQLSSTSRRPAVTSRMSREMVLTTNALGASDVWHCQHFCLPTLARITNQGCGNRAAADRCRWTHP